jgi:CBS domain-containing protein
MKIKQILHGKKINTIYSVTSSTSVYDTLVLMSDKNIGAVMVIDDGKLAGIFSERDYARKIILKGKHSDDTPVSDVMTAKVITIEPDKKLEDVMQIMSDKHIRHLPVVDGENLLGIISISDVVTAIIRDQKERIASLEGYISGSYA